MINNKKGNIPMNDQGFIELKGVGKNFGGLVALNDISLHVNQGEIFGIIGPNGAGKTTLFNVIAGFLPASAGSIRFKGEELSGLRPDQICHHGITRTFQIPHLFNQLTALQNMMVGSFMGTKARAVSEKASMEILELFGLQEKAQEKAENLTYLDCKRLEFARALATKPELLMLDETMGGLTPTEAQEMMAIILQLRDQGTTFIIIEHVMQVIIGLCDRIGVLHNARVICEGSADYVCNDPTVIEAYLGEEISAGS
jgi:branched-chain amino acid transport system ATP-binding protein